MDSAEIRVNRRQTIRFINDNPVMIEFKRPGARVSDGAGGWTTSAGSTLAPQKVRMVIQPRAGTVQRNIDSETVDPQYVIIGEHDLDVGMNDAFVLENRNYSVKFIREDRRYETWVEVLYDG